MEGGFDVLASWLSLGGTRPPRTKSMTRKVFTLLLLATFGFGLLGGPHPCKASHAERESRPSSCHQAADSSNDLEVLMGASPSSEDSGCCDTFCRHACHMTAVAGGEPMAFAIAPVSETVVEVSVSALPLFAHPIDHVPLA